METNLLVFDVGSTYTKVAGFQMTGGQLSLTGRAQASTTVDDIERGIAAAKQNLAATGVTIAAEPQIFSTSSAAGGLRMVALGYMPRVTAKAAKEVAMSAGARVLEIISSEDPPEYRLQVLMESSRTLSCWQAAQMAVTGTRSSAMPGSSFRPGARRS